MRMMIVMPLGAIVAMQLMGCSSTPKHDLAHNHLLKAQDEVREAISLDANYVVS